MKEKLISKKLLKCLDGLTYSFALMDNSYSGLQNTCQSVLKDDSNFTIALGKCWQFIDNLHRVREISQSIPGLNHREDALRNFLDLTCTCKDFRNYIQHLRNELLAPEGKDSPAFGNLTWIDTEHQNYCYIVLSGIQIDRQIFRGISYDNQEGKWSCRIGLNIGDMSFDFERYYHASIDFKNFILPWILNKFSGSIEFREKLKIYRCHGVRINNEYTEIRFEVVR